MKKLTTILAAAMIFISASSFAADGPVSSKIQMAFEKNFISASDVRWQKISNNYFALFTINNQDLSAAYNEDGELLATSRTLNLSQLPMIVTLALQDRYPKYTFGDVITEITANGESYYLIKGGNDKRVISLRAGSSGTLSVESNKKRK